MIYVKISSVSDFLKLDSWNCLWLLFLFFFQRAEDNLEGYRSVCICVPQLNFHLQIHRFHQFYCPVREQQSSRIFYILYASYKLPSVVLNTHTHNCLMNEHLLFEIELCTQSGMPTMRAILNCTAEIDKKYYIFLVFFRPLGSCFIIDQSWG